MQAGLRVERVRPVKGARVLLITGGYYPAPGGAANYSHTLSHLLLKYGVAETLEVFTERYPGAMNRDHDDSSGLIVRRSMPRRATSSKKSVWGLFLYAFQLIQISNLILKATRRFDIVILHGSLIYHTGLLGRIVWLARRLDKGNKTRYFLDVRDPLMPVRRVPIASLFHGVVACSRNVSQDLAVKGLAQDRIHEIPIPLTPHPESEVESPPVCAKFELKERNYVFVAHGITPRKRTEEVVEAVGYLRGEGMSISLAIAGKARYWPESVAQAEKAGWLYYLGSLPNDQIRDLMAECLIHVNVCALESIGRASLEAIAAGALTVLPPGVPEFEECCPEWIGTAGDAQRLAKEIKLILERGAPAPYPLERHHPKVVARAYGDLFSGQNGRVLESAESCRS